MATNQHAKAAHGASHTPGPWTLEPYSTTRSRDGMAYVKADSRIVCEVWYDKEIEEDVVHGDEGRANARLIAAAPRMLDLLQRIANETCDHGAQTFCPREDARAILREIEGGISGTLEGAPAPDVQGGE